MDLLKTSLSVFSDFKLTSRLSMALMFKMLLALESIKYSTLHSSLVNISTQHYPYIHIIKEQFDFYVLEI